MLIFDGVLSPPAGALSPSSLDTPGTLAPLGLAVKVVPEAEEAEEDAADPAAAGPAAAGSVAAGVFATGAGWGEVVEDEMLGRLALGPTAASPPRMSWSYSWSSRDENRSSPPMLEWNSIDDVGMGRWSYAELRAFPAKGEGSPWVLLPRVALRSLAPGDPSAMKPGPFDGVGRALPAGEGLDRADPETGDSARWPSSGLREGVS